MSRREPTTEAIIQLQDNLAYDCVPQRVKTGVIETIKAALLGAEESRFTQKEITQALRYLIAETNPDLLDKNKARQLDRNRAAADPFYYPSSSWDLSDALLLNMALSNTAPTDCSPGGDCGGDGEGAIAALGAAAVCASCLCLYCTYVNSKDTLTGQESVTTKGLKLITNALGFAAGAVGTGILFYMNEGSVEIDSGLYWFLASAVSLVAGASASAITSYTNSSFPCQSKQPPQELLDELEDIKGLLRGNWLGDVEPGSKAEQQTKEFIREAVKIYIEGKYAPNSAHEHVIDMGASGFPSAPAASCEPTAPLLGTGGGNTYGSSGIFGDSRASYQQLQHSQDSQERSASLKTHYER